MTKPYARMTVVKQILKAGTKSAYQTVETEEKVITEKEYRNIVEASPFFHVSQSSKQDTIVKTHSDMITDDYIIQQMADLLHFGVVDIEAKFKTDAVLSVYSLVQPYLDYEM